MRAEKTEKSFHRWSPAEDARLLAEMERQKAAFEMIGKPGGIPRAVFWAQIPGRIDVLTTWVGASMRYRTLTSKTEWAKARREKRVSKGETPEFEFPAKGAETGSAIPDPIKVLADIRDTLHKLLNVWAPPSSRGTASD